ncbi:MAG: hypothetical protein A2Y56_00285 [Candidatus Aminicenantes bacterium RBG_13_63_10]|nr:MAG: hypothetical protein A2Y56_00285 [Candidatus Aminicenantes bacterium RBG_13_63_10]
MRLERHAPDEDRGPGGPGGVGLDILVSLGAAVWLAAADALALVGASKIPWAEFFLRPFGPWDLSPAGYVLLLLLAFGAALGSAVGGLQHFWVRTPWPWRPALSALVVLNFAFLLLSFVRLQSLEGEVQGRYFGGLAVAFVLLVAAALSIPAWARAKPDGSAARCAGRTAAALSLLICLGIAGGPLVSHVLLPRAPRSGGTARRPNILILMLDTVRADALSCLDPSTGRTPRLDAMASEGVLFRRAIVPAPWTVPSHASLFTGLFPSQHGVVWERPDLGRDQRTLAEILYESGYRTIAFSENPHLTRAAGFAQGFDDLHELFLDPRRAVVPGLWASVRGRAFDRPPTYEYTAESISHLIRWLRGNALREDSPPFFAFLNLMAGHLPAYPRREFNPAIPPAEVVERLAPINLMPQRFNLPAFALEPGDLDVLRMWYAGDVAYLDARLGRLFDFLRARRLLDDTILVILADHGENLGHHGLIEHAFCLYNSLLHVPLIIRFPAKVPAGTVRRDIVSTVRLFDTILDLAGVGRSVLPAGPRSRSLMEETPEDEVFAESENLVGLLREALPNEPSAAGFDYSPFDKSLTCLFSGGYKLIRASDGRVELYDTGADWEESKDLAESEPRRVKALKEKLDLWEKRLVRTQPRPVRPPKVERGAREALKALGYIH